MGEIRRVMRAGGTACFMLPNQYYYRYVIDKALRKKEPTSYQAIERFAPYGEWKKLIESNGFRVKKVYKYNKFNRSPFMVFVRSIFVPLALSHHFVFILGKD
jgi:hypothetical protein